MTSSQPPSQLQAMTLEAFTALSVISPSWAGRLVLSVGLNERGTALAVATNIAGGVSLSVDDNAARIREVVRNGTMDFVVNTLDEALRAMKNELRKQAPLSVALKADPDQVLAELLERGLAPNLFSRFANLGSEEIAGRASAQFASLGTTLLDFERVTESTAPDSYLALDVNEVIEPLLNGERWSLVTFQAESAARLRDFDTQALAMLPAKDTLRRRWGENVPRILQRQRPPHRSLWLTAEETAVLEAGGFRRLNDGGQDSLPE